MMFVRGDYVVYDPGYKDPEIGRVTEDRGGTVFVCYTSGCTAAGTPKEKLRMATNTEVGRAPKDLGYNRFAAFCPIWDEDVCAGMCTEKARQR